MTHLMRRFCAGLALLAAVMTSGCGGGGAPPPLLLQPPDVELGEGRVYAVLVDVPDAVFARVEVAFDLLSVGYLQQFAGPGQAGHFGLVARADLPKRAQAIWGQGVIFGTVFDQVRRPQIETWCNGVEPENYLFPSPAAPELQDGITYRVTFVSQLDGQAKRLRYRIQAPGLDYDSGEVLDPNALLDVRKNGVWVGHVFSGPGDWSIQFKNIQVRMS